MKNIKMILITAIAAMVLTGCGMNTIRENGNSYVEEISTSATIEESVNSYEESNIFNEDSSSNVAKPENTSSENVSSSTNEPVENPVESSTTTNNSTSSTIEEKPESSSTKIEEKPISSSSTSSSSNKPVEKPVSSSTSSSSTNKPVSSSSNKPVENPVSSSSTNKPTSSSTKIEEKPIHTHNFTEATCTNPATCISCGETKGTTINHNYNNGSCIYCGKNDPNYVAPHNCKYDGHIWNNSYTESSTENVDIIETHTLSANGYDYDLAYRYFGRTSSDVDWSDRFGTGFGSGSSKVKTTGVKTITRFIHECSECGYKEVYNTEETVTPGETWVFVNKPRSEYFPLIWWDINNIPDEVYEGVEARQKAIEEWANSL